MDEYTAVIGITANAQDLENVSKKQDEIYTNFTQKGVSYITPYMNDALDDIAGVVNDPTKHEAVKKTNLFEQMKEGADTTSKALNELAKALNEGNKIQKDLVKATHNMGANIFGSVLAVATEITQGNKINSINARTGAIVGETQIKKNIQQEEFYQFQNNGRPGIVDSKGNPIKPVEATAKANAESAITNHFNNTGKVGDEQIKDSQDNPIVPNVASAKANAERWQDDDRMNRFDHGSLLDRVGSSSDDMLKEGGNLIDEALSFFNKIDVNELDNLVQNDKEFTNA